MATVKYKDNQRKHLSAAERGKIDSGLTNHRTLTDIARELGRPTSTILREIRRNSEFQVGNSVTCANSRDCKKQHMCGDMDCDKVCGSVCKYKCRDYCDEYERIICQRLQKSPYVCNGCNKKNRDFCHHDKRLYRPEIAHKKYRNQLVECRRGFDLT